MPPQPDARTPAREARAKRGAAAKIYEALWRLHFRARVAAGRGALPNALVIGASKGGTTSVHHWLAQHPDVCGSRIKEVCYFDSHYEKGPRWYAAQFAPKLGQGLLLEASPSYLWDPHVPARVRALLGTPRLIVLLREPVDRAWSQYWMKVRRGEESASFEEMLGEEARRYGLGGQMPEDGSVSNAEYGRYSYLGKGLYAPQLDRWLAVFPKEAFHFIKSEDLFATPELALGGLLDFMDLRRTAIPNLSPRNSGTYPPLDPSLRRELEPVFFESNARVRALTGIFWP